MKFLEIVLLIHFCATSYMTGVIWLIQRVHYPMLADLDKAHAGAACAFHARRIAPVVAIPMVVEAAAAVWLAMGGLRDGQGHTLALAGLAMLGLIWLITFVRAVPLHARLAAQSGEVDRSTVSALVAWNWPRTILWSARLVCAAALFEGNVTR